MLIRKPKIQLSMGVRARKQLFCKSSLSGKMSTEHYCAVADVGA